MAQFLKLQEIKITRRTYYARNIICHHLLFYIQAIKGHCYFKNNLCSGLVYEYKNVPEEIYNAMITSGSKGIYFNRHINGQYEFKPEGLILL